MGYFIKRKEHQNKTILFMILAYMLLFSVAAFSQSAIGNNVSALVIENKETVNNDKVEPSDGQQEMASSISGMNFILWFMGGKQNLDTIVLPVETIERKQFRVSGATPNRLLIRVFLKKVISFDSVIV